MTTDPEGGLPPAERAFLEAGWQWIDDNGDRLIDLLIDLVARPSVTGTEGTHDDPDTTVGRLYEFLADAAGLTVEAQPIPDDAEYLDAERENLYAVMEGAGAAGFIGLSHTDIVPPGSRSAWPGDAPYAVSEGTVTRTDRRTVRLTVDGVDYERTIRENLADVWDKRGDVEPEVLVGRGVYDNKACSVCLAGCLLGALAARDATGNGLGGDLIHGHLVDEEKDEIGVMNMVGWRSVDDDWLGTRYDAYDGFTGVTLEGQYGFVPVVGHRGGINTTVRATGEAVHASTPHLGRNAVLGMAKALTRLDTPDATDRLASVFRSDELLGEFTIAPGTTIVGGGVKRVDADATVTDRDGEYAVPDWCEATIDCRVPRWDGFPENPEAVERRFLSTLRGELEAAAPGIEFDIEVNNFFYPVALGEDRADSAAHPLVETATRSTRAVCGYSPEIAVAPGATDTWVLYHGTRIPTLVEYGPAGALSHEPLEFVERRQVIDGAKAVLDMAVRQLGVVSGAAG